MLFYIIARGGGSNKLESGHNDILQGLNTDVHVWKASADVKSHITSVLIKILSISVLPANWPESFTSIIHFASLFAMSQMAQAPHPQWQHP